MHSLLGWRKFTAVLTSQTVATSLQQIFDWLCLCCAGAQECILEDAPTPVTSWCQVSMSWTTHRVCSEMWQSYKSATHCGYRINKSTVRPCSWRQKCVHHKYRNESSEMNFGHHPAILSTRTCRVLQKHNAVWTAEHAWPYEEAKHDQWELLCNHMMKMTAVTMPASEQCHNCCCGLRCYQGLIMNHEWTCPALFWPSSSCFSIGIIWGV